MYDTSAVTKTGYRNSLLRALIVLCCLYSSLAQASPSNETETFALKYPKKSVTLTSFTRPKSTMTISSEVSGRCLSVSGNVGDFIDESTPFIRIDPTFILLDIKANQLAQEKLKRKILFDKQELNRYEKLLATQSVPQAKLDQIHLSYDLSTIELKGLITAEKKLKELLKRHEIIAPPTYQVIERYIEPGEMINVGQKLARLGDFQELLLPLFLTLSEYKALLDLPSIPISLPDLNLTLQAEYFRTTPGFDPKSRKKKVELIITKQQLRQFSLLRGGERALLKINIQDQMGSYEVPASALQERHDVFWLTSSKGEKRDVIVLGEAAEDGYILVNGATLEPGERFFVQPNN